MSQVGSTAKRFRHKTARRRRSCTHLVTTSILFFRASRSFKKLFGNSSFFGIAVCSGRIGTLKRDLETPHSIEIGLRVPVYKLLKRRVFSIFRRRAEMGQDALAKRISVLASSVLLIVDVKRSFSLAMGNLETTEGRVHYFRHYCNTLLRARQGHLQY
jgi:hypothetical protein